MSLRRKACAACAVQKRRCDYDLPACRRCAKMSIPCKYPHFPPLTHEPSPVTPRSEITKSRVVEDSEASVWDRNINSDLLSGNAAPLSFIDGLDELLPVSWDFLSDDQLGDDSFTLSWLTEDNHDVADTLKSQPIESSKRKRHEIDQEHRPFRQRTSSPKTTVLDLELSSVQRPLYNIWPRWKETKTWSFCAKELFSNIGLYAKTSSTTFIFQPTHDRPTAPDRLHPYLQAALGVCAAHQTLGDENQLRFTQLLDTEINRLVKSSKFQASPYSVHNMGREYPRHSALEVFRDELARLQAVLLYQIIRLFGRAPEQRHLAELLEPLLASWTTSLQLRLEVLELKSEMNNQATSPSSVILAGVEPDVLEQEERESAYRTILTSYMVRAIYAVQRYKFCPFLPELDALRVPVPSNCLAKSSVEPEQLNRSRLTRDYEGQWFKVISYRQLTDSWGQNSALSVNQEDKFINLLLVACRGPRYLASIS